MDKGGELVVMKTSPWPLAVAPAAAVSAIFGCCVASGGQQPDPYREPRERMVQSEVVDRGIRNPRVIEAMRRVPRHLFVPADQQKFAYADAALPIGHGQTITSPYVVAYMTEQLEPQPTDKVLEIGTGSGYQASVLSGLVQDVYTIEIVEPLGRRAAALLRRLGYQNVHVKVGDGYQGWPEHAPFDKIIVTCSPEDVPPALIEQLREGGRLIVPLGERFQQTLELFRKVDSQLVRERLDTTFFVPMTGRAEQLRVKLGAEITPEIVNGSFEEEAGDQEVPGWFYVRQAAAALDEAAPEGRRVLQLSNSVPGQNAHALQAIGLDGRVVRVVRFSIWSRVEEIVPTREHSILPRAELTFYDERRTLIHSHALGPWEARSGWVRHSEEIRVPGRSRFAVIVVGMFGAVGRIAVDDVSIDTMRTGR